MAVGFNSIPIDLRTPGQFIEFDMSRATNGASGQVNRVLLYGQKLAAGSATAGVAVQVRTADEAKALFGRGSMLARMVEFYRKNDAVSELWAVPLADDAGGTAQTKTITITGPATAAGALIVRIGGQRLAVSVANAASATNIATAIVTAITAAPDLPVSATSAVGVVTLTAKHKGEAGKDIDVRINNEAGELNPAGVTTAVASVTAGAGNPATDSVFTAIGDQPFTAIVCPYTDATSLGVLETTLVSRWGPMKNLDGLGYSAATGSLAALTTLGSGRNAQFVSILGAKGPTPPWEQAAAYAAQVSYAGSIDPARPFQGLPLLGVQPPSIGERFTQPERDSLLRDGISTFTVAGGAVMIERAITTYQLNALGLDDTAWLDVNTPLTLSTLRYTLRSRIAAKYGRHKLVNDDSSVSPGQFAIGPKGLRAEVIAWFQDCQAQGWVEGIDQFKADLVLERDANDPSRVNALIPPDLVNGLRIFAAVIQPRL